MLLRSGFGRHPGHDRASSFSIKPESGGPAGGAPIGGEGAIQIALTIARGQPAHVAAGGRRRYSRSPS